MPGFILGEKSQQSQRYTETGEIIPTTFIRTSPCYLVSLIDPSTRGYMAVQLGFGTLKNIKKPVLGQLKKAGIETPLHFLKEFRVESPVQFIEENGKKGFAIGETKVFVGEALNPTVMFKVGDMITVTGTSKGKGFQGVVKRHGFAGGPRTHGQSDRERAPGSIGQTTTPGKVYRGKRMAGRMGGDTISVRNLQVVEVTDQGITVKGVVPGARNGLLELAMS